MYTLCDFIYLKIRSDIRNPWAHCDFTEWDSIKYLSSFQMMNQLIKNLKLPTTDENRVLGELQIWESNGKYYENKSNEVLLSSFLKV